MSRKVFMLFAVLVLGSTAAWAKPPIYVSFASDDYHEGPTFTGYGAKIQAKARVDLMLDQQGDFEGGVVIFPSWFTFDGEIVDRTIAVTDEASAVSSTTAPRTSIARMPRLVIRSTDTSAAARKLATADANPSGSAPGSSMCHLLASRRSAREPDGFVSSIGTGQ